MLSILARNWWALALRGLFAVLFGLAAFFWPQITLTAMIYLFGAYALLDGVFAMLLAFEARNPRRSWWALLLEGTIGIGVGLISFVWPQVTALALAILLAIWALLTGIAEIAAAIQLRRVIHGEWLLGLAGALSIAFGVLVLVFPGAGLLALLWLIGAYALVFGVLLLILALRLRRWRDLAPMI